MLYWVLITPLVLKFPEHYRDIFSFSAIVGCSHFRYVDPTTPCVHKTIKGALKSCSL